MQPKLKIPLSKLISEFNLHVCNMPDDPELIFISSREMARPGLPLAGFVEVYRQYGSSRIQLFGRSEMAYLATMDSLARRERIDTLFSFSPPLAIIAHGHEPFAEMLASAKMHSVPLVTSDDDTSALLASMLNMLNIELAPRITRHAVLMEIYGDGVLLLGSSGIGKSETAVELIVRGHRLIADDAVEIRRVSSRNLVGSSPDNIRHFMELRGIGVINAQRIFGMSAVKMTGKIDFIIQMELWDDKKTYDRLGNQNDYMEILGIRVPCITIPVKPGRNLAVIVEVATMNNRLKRLGYSPTQELMHNLGMSEEYIPPVENILNNNYWDIGV